MAQQAITNPKTNPEWIVGQDSNAGAWYSPQLPDIRAQQNAAIQNNLNPPMQGAQSSGTDYSVDAIEARQRNGQNSYTPVRETAAPAAASTPPAPDNTTPVSTAPSAASPAGGTAAPSTAALANTAGQVVTPEGYTLQGYQAQSAPALQGYQAQSVPTLQSYTAQELPGLQAYQALTAPTLRSYQAQEAPELQAYRAQAERVGQTYDAARDAQHLALENQYNMSRAENQRAAEQIPEYYRQQALAAEQQAARNRLAFNESAAASGLNTGAGSQAQLAQNAALQGNLTAIGTARANAEAEAQFQLMQMERQYQNAVSEALANNEYERAAALMQEYQREAESTVNAANQRALLGFQEQQTAQQSAVDAANQQALLQYQEQQAAAQSAQEIANQLALLGYQDRQTAAQSAVEAANQRALLGFQEQQTAARSAQEIANQRALLNFQEQQAAAQSAQQTANQQAALDYQMRTAQQSAAEQRAATLAQYGDFSGYGALGYSEAEQNAMRQAWIAQNPDLAVAMGYRQPSYSGTGNPTGADAAYNALDSATQYTINRAIQEAQNGNTNYLQDIIANGRNNDLMIRAQTALNYLNTYAS